MDGRNSLGMGGSGSENDEVFGGLSPLEFRYPESNSINLDLDANYLLDNPSETTIHPSTDVLPDQTVVHDGGISAAQADEFHLLNQERTILNSSPIPDQRTTGMSFTNLLIQGMNSGEIPSQKMTGTSCTNFLTQGMNHLTVPSQDMSELGSSRFTTQNINTSGVPYQPPSVYTTMGNNRGSAEIIVISSSDDEQLQEESDSTDDEGDSDSNPKSILRKSISKEMITQYFHLSLPRAARALNVCSTVLKKRCRELAIKRWPQRKIKSLDSIIASLQKSGESSGSRVGEDVQEKIRRLEDERKRMEDNPDLPLEPDTIRLRQTLYKSSHKKRRQSDRDH